MIRRPCSTALFLGLTLVAATAALVWTALHRGPWYDELFTWAVTQPHRPFRDALWHSWLADNHPPLFAIMTWLLAHFAGSIEALRLINLLGLLIAAFGGWLLVRHNRNHGVVALLFLLMLVANETFLRNGSELRSYFWSLCASSVAVLALTVGWLDHGLSRPGARRVLWLAIIVGFNLHIVTSVIMAALIGPALVAAWLGQRRALFWQVFWPTLVGGTLFSATCLIQLPLWQSNTAQFWIPAGPAAALAAIRYGLLRAAEANWLILAGGCAGVVLLARAAFRHRTISDPAQMIAVLACGIVLACAVLLAMHMIRPVVIERYLAGLIPAIAMGVALSCMTLLATFPALARASLLGLALALTLASLIDHARYTTARKSWQGTASWVGAAVRSCPDSPVHIAPAVWNANTYGLPPADNKLALSQGYTLLAARNGFTLAPSASRRLSAHCPSLFWAEHDTTRAWRAPAILAQLRDQGFAVSRIWFYRIGDGWIASTGPLDGLRPDRYPAQ